MNLTELVKADSEAADLVGRMLEYRVVDRISSEDVVLHPFFWSALKKLTFLQDLSDRLDVENKDNSLLLAAFEEDAEAVFGQGGWHKMVDKSLYENLGKYRKYNANSLQDLLRAIRNKKNHYQDLPQHVKTMFGIMPDGFLLYFTLRFPKLLPTLYRFVEDTELKDENVMRPYFEI
jgi:serine/threonine-protein kinase/endoribonuclease IRE1